jgi:hypothetical protein
VMRPRRSKSGCLSGCGNSSGNNATRHSPFQLFRSRPPEEDHNNAAAFVASLHTAAPATPPEHTHRLPDRPICPPGAAVGARGCSAPADAPDERGQRSRVCRARVGGPRPLPPAHSTQRHAALQAPCAGAGGRPWRSSHQRL